MQEENELENSNVNQKQVEECIATLNSLLVDTDQLFELPEEIRVELMKVSGLLSRPSREELTKQRKNSKKAEKRKKAERDKHARKNTGIRSAREASVFVAPKLLVSPVSPEDQPD